MPRVLTKSAPLTCGHVPPPPPGPPVPAPPPPGRVQTVGTPKLTVQQSEVLLESGVLLQAVTGCPTPQSSSTAPCTSVNGITSGRAQKLTAGGLPVMLQTISGTTLGNPVGGVTALAAGSTRLNAV